VLTVWERPLTTGDRVSPPDGVRPRERLLDVRPGERAETDVTCCPPRQDPDNRVGCSYFGGLRTSGSTAWHLVSYPTMCKMVVFYPSRQLTVLPSSLSPWAYRSRVNYDGLLIGWTKARGPVECPLAGVEE